MKLKNLCALVLAGVLVLGMAACGKKDPQEEWKQLEIEAQAPDEEVFLAQAVGKLYLYADAAIQLAYDQDGNVVAVVGENQLGMKIDAAYDFTDKTCSQAVLELTNMILSDESANVQNFVLVRQGPDSVTPSDKFMKTVEKYASANKGKLPVITVAAADCNDEGCIPSDVALRLLKLAVPALAEKPLACAEDAASMGYSVLVSEGGKATMRYLVDGFSGAVQTAAIEAEEQQEEPQEVTEPEEELSDYDIFGGPTDEDIYGGTDGTVDNGSIDFN